MKKNLTKSIVLILVLMIISIIGALLIVKENLKRNLSSEIEKYIQKNNLGEFENLEFVSKGKCYKKHHFDDPLGMQGPEEQTKKINFCDSYKYKVKFVNDDNEYYIYSYINGFDLTIKEHIKKVKEDITYISSIVDYKKISYELNPIYDSRDYIYESDDYLWSYEGYTSIIPNIIVVEVNDSISDNPYIIDELKNWLISAEKRNITLKIIFKDNYMIEESYEDIEGSDVYIYKNGSLLNAYTPMYLYGQNFEQELKKYFNWQEITDLVE